MQLLNDGGQGQLAQVFGVPFNYFFDGGIVCYTFFNWKCFENLSNGIVCLRNEIKRKDNKYEFKIPEIFLLSICPGGNS
jgi:hypothetical protein